MHLVNGEQNGAEVWPVGTMCLQDGLERIKGLHNVARLILGKVGTLNNMTVEVIPPGRTEEMVEVVHYRRIWHGFTLGKESFRERTSLSKK
jgi:hypothetical protein